MGNVLATVAPAAVIPVDLESPGDALLTRDLDNGLDWLDLSQTMQGGMNRTFNDVSGQLGPGGEFDGFRHATATEIEAFWTSAGIPDINSGGTAANFVPVTNLIGLLGDTSSPEPVSTFSFGILADSNAPGTHQAAMIDLTSPSTARARSLASPGNVADDMTDIAGGHFLVRSAPAAIPEPSSFALLGVAAAGFCSSRLRRRRQAARIQVA